MKISLRANYETMTESSVPTADYFKAGGTLGANAPSYVARPADELLLRHILGGQLCYVLTTRQMGKSSLMVRTAASLRSLGVGIAVIDLSSLGVQVSPSQWYLGIITQIADDLGVAVNAAHWWRENDSRGVVQRFIDFFSDVLLENVQGRVVVFLDEIDSTLNLAFTDDFFAAVRALYNERAVNSRYDRLTFVLLGVVTPAHLIKDRNRTPFNVGVPVQLKEFSRSDAWSLEVGLERTFPGCGAALLDRIFYWTNGHPYLTQRLCSATVTVAASTDSDPTKGPETGEKAASDLVDRCVEHLFLAKDAVSDENLQFIRSRIAATSDRRPLLTLYRRIYQGDVIGEDERSPQQNELKLIGLVSSNGGKLRIYNEIYRHVFDLDWIRANIPVNWAPFITWGAAAVIVLAVALLVVLLRWQEDRQVADFKRQFDRSAVPQIRLANLADLCSLRSEAARAAFFTLPVREQLELFRQVDIEVAGERTEAVVSCLWPALASQPAALRSSQMEAMCAAVKRWCSTLGLPSGNDNDGRCVCPTLENSR